MKKIVLLLLFASATFAGCKKDDKVHHPDINAKVNGTWLLQDRKGTWTEHPSIPVDDILVLNEDLTYEMINSKTTVAKGSYKLSIERTPDTNVDMQVLTFDNAPNIKVFTEVLDKKLILDFSKSATDVGQAIYAKTTGV